MGVLSCQRCGATAEGETFEQADERIDHAVGLSKGRACSGKTSDLIWNGAKTLAEHPEPDELVDTESDSSKPKKSKRR